MNEQGSFLSVLPPLIAIVLGFLTRQVLLSLFIGIWLGAFIAHDFNAWASFFRVLDTYILDSFADKDHAAILIFTLFIGAITSLIHYNGGTRGMVNWFVSRAQTTRSIQMTTWFLGLAIFFDDYANSLVVGKSMRPLFDRFKISREKLAFIVDATAAPVTSIALVSTWVTMEVGLISEGIKGTPFEATTNGFSMFVASIPYRFYPLLMIFFVGYLIWTQKDFFSMHRYETRARNAPDPKESTSAQDDGESKNPKAFNAVVPLVLLILSATVSLWVTGASGLDDSGMSFFERMRAVFGNADPYKSLLWATLLTVVVTIIMSISQKLMSLDACMNGILKGFESMTTACTILVLAWSLGAITKELHTTEYLLGILSDSLSPNFLPAIVFITGALVSFATGTSWGTMAILMPIVIPLSIGLCQSSGMALPEMQVILTASIGSILAGAVFGDHCSPISDTSVMSAASSECDLMDHIRTQLPYALLVGGVGIVVGDLAIAMGVSPYISLIVGVAILIAAIQTLGKKVA